jgi:hypothetical protein
MTGVLAAIAGLLTVAAVAVVASIDSTLDSFTGTWAPRIVATAATLVALGVIWRYIVKPAVSVVRRGFRALLVVADRYEDIAEHGSKIDELSVKIDSMVEQNDRDHAWTRQALDGIAEWSGQFKNFDAIQLPPHPSASPTTVITTVTTEVAP